MYGSDEKRVVRAGRGRVVFNDLIPEVVVVDVCVDVPVPVPCKFRKVERDVPIWQNPSFWLC